MTSKPDTAPAKTSKPKRPPRTPTEAGEFGGKVKDATLDITEAVWKKALDDAHGIVAHAAAELQIARRHASRLNRKFDLNDYAADLRVAAGGKPRGRQPGT